MGIRYTFPEWLFQSERITPVKVLITGAAGFIGSHITKAFCRRHAVTVLVRKRSRRDFLARYPVNVLEGDLRDKLSIEAAVKDQELIVHAGGKVGDWGPYQDFLETNVEGSLHLIEAVAPGTRVIFLSSCAVLGEEDCPEPKEEGAPYKPVCPYAFESILPSGMNHYRITKTIAEQMLIQKATLKGVDLSVIRPVWVFGPREFHAGPYEYCKTVLDGLPAMAGSRRNRLHVIFVEDLARLILRVAEKQKPGIHVYTAGNPEVPLMDDYWALYCKALGRPKPPIFPPFLLYPLAILLELLWTFAGAKEPPLITRARLYMFRASNVYGTRKLQEDFGFDAFTPLDRAVRKTVRWWRLNGYL